MATQRKAKKKTQKKPPVKLDASAEVGFHFSGKLCPDGCCMDIVLSRADAVALTAEDVAYFSREVLPEIVKKHGLPTRSPRTSSSTVLNAH